MEKNFSVMDALENVSQAVVAGNSSGKILFANKAAVALYNMELKGKRLTDIFPADVLEMDSDDCVLPCERQGKHLEIRKSSREKMTLYYIDQQETEKKRLALTRGGMSRLREYAFGLKMSLNAYTGVNEELREDKNIAVLYKFIYRMTRAVNQFDTADKLIRGEAPFTPQEVNLDEILSSVIDNLKSLFSEEQVSFKYTCEPEGISAEVDRVLFETMILNLLANSLSSDLPSNSIELSVSRAEEKILIVLKDSGPGIPEEKMSNVTGLPRDKDPLSPKSSLGLGLYIVGKIVDLHKGSILVESGPDKGTKVMIKLPVVQNSGGKYKFKSKNVAIESNGLQNVLTGLADVLPVSSFGPECED